MNMTEYRLIHDATALRKFIIDDEIKYDDWLWECPMPNMGG